MSDTNDERLKTQLERLRTAGPDDTKPRPAVRDRVAEVSSAAPPSGPTLAQPETPARISLTLESICDVLDQMEAKYFVDGDDAVGGIWENGYFFFFILHEYENPLFQVFAQWEKVLPVDVYPQAAIFSNEWNAENAWPKAYARVWEEEETGLYAEMTSDFGPSLTPTQLDDAINAGIAGALAFFDEAELTFPDAVEMEF